MYAKEKLVAGAGLAGSMCGLFGAGYAVATYSAQAGPLVEIEAPSLATDRAGEPPTIDFPDFSLPEGSDKVLGELAASLALFGASTVVTWRAARRVRVYSTFRDELHDWLSEFEEHNVRGTYQEQGDEDDPA